MSHDDKPPHGSPSGADPRLLAELTRELRDLPPPDVDFDRIEAELLRRLDAGEGAPRPAARPRVALIAALAVAAGVGGLWFASRPAVAPVAEQRPAPAAEPTRPDIVRIETGADAQRGQKDGLASWTVEPGSVASLSDDGSRVVVTLEQGALSVDVIPQPVAERFVIVAGNTRVAVRGTWFRVARVGERVEVDVARGTVAVSSADGSGGEPVLLRAKVGGTFGLGGAAGGELREFRAFAPGQEAAAPHPPATAVADTRPSPAPKAPEHAPPPALDAAALQAKLSAVTSDCFQAHAAKLAPTVNLTATTTLHAAVDTSGALSDLSFDPPLSPSVEACVRSAAAPLRGREGAVSIPMTLVGRR